MVMKRIPVLLLMLLLSVWMIPLNLPAQVRVIEKPVPPKSQLKIPPKTDDGYVLLPGRWIWYRPAKMYVWLPPVWTEPPKGKVWSPGYWKTMKKGWVWVPGKWENKKHFWNRL